jgi:hypothetical protein
MPTYFITKNEDGEEFVTEDGAKMKLDGVDLVELIDGTPKQADIDLHIPEVVIPAEIRRVRAFIDDKTMPIPVVIEKETD